MSIVDIKSGRKGFDETNMLEDGLLLRSLSVAQVILRMSSLLSLASLAIVICELVMIFSFDQMCFMMIAVTNQP